MFENLAALVSSLKNCILPCKQYAPYRQYALLGNMFPVDNMVSLGRLLLVGNMLHVIIEYLRLRRQLNCEYILALLGLEELLWVLLPGYGRLSAGRHLPRGEWPQPQVIRPGRHGQPRMPPDWRRRRGDGEQGRGELGIDQTTGGWKGSSRQPDLIRWTLFDFGSLVGLSAANNGLWTWQQTRSKELR